VIDRFANLHRRLDDLDCMVTVTRNLKHQQATAITTLSELEALNTGATQLIIQLKETRKGPSQMDELLATHKPLVDRFDGLRANLHERISFVARAHEDASAVDDLLGFKLQEQDDAVRGAINERCAQVASRLQELNDAANWQRSQVESRDRDQGDVQAPVAASGPSIKGTPEREC
jgi:hypothetical protein